MCLCLGEGDVCVGGGGGERVCVCVGGGGGEWLNLCVGMGEV